MHGVNLLLWSRFKKSVPHHVPHIITSNTKPLIYLDLKSYFVQSIIGATDRRAERETLENGILFIAVEDLEYFSLFIVLVNQMQPLGKWNLDASKVDPDGLIRISRMKRHRVQLYAVSKGIMGYKTERRF